MSHVTLFALAICVLLLVTFAEASLSKLLGGSTPDWFVDTFKDTWLGKLPIPMMWWSIAIAELVVAALVVVSLATMEPFTEGPDVWLERALLLGMVVFAGLSFGQRVSLDFVGSANSYFYAALTGGLWFALHLVAV